MLNALEASGPINRTNLAQKTGLNYNVCLRYIKMLSVLGWIEMCSSAKGDCVSITEVGRQVSAKLLDTSTSTIAAAYNTGGGRAARGLQGEEKEGRQQQQQPQPSGHALSGGEEKVKRFAQTSSSLAAGAKSKSRNIMIVDDEPDIAVTYQYFLASEGYNVEAFSDAYSALREFTRHSSYYDLIILDIRMPGLNGLQLYQSLKGMNPSCKVIFISALDAAREMVSILPGVTADDIMKKPVDKKSFLRKINEIFS
ncbi:putative signal transduction response regulator, receiver domain [Nitrososphaera viennensis EN76]|nr:putative signal transduction response regulator, receiver domain [Nitrososphaera viennensis EN76]